MAKGQGIVGGLLRDRSSALQGLSHPVSVSFRGQKGLSLAACLLNEAAQLLQELQGHVSAEVLKYIGKNELGLLKAVKDANIFVVHLLVLVFVCRSASQREKTFHVLLVLCRSVRNDYIKTFRCSCCFVGVWLLLLLFLFCSFVYFYQRN